MGTKWRIILDIPFFLPTNYYLIFNKMFLPTRKKVGIPLHSFISYLITPWLTLDYYCKKTSLIRCWSLHFHQLLNWWSPHSCPTLCKGRGLSFQNFPKKRWDLEISLKKWGEVKIGGSKKEFLKTTKPFLKFYFPLHVICVFWSFTPFLSVFFVFHRKKLALFNQIGRYVTPSISGKQRH